MNTWLKQQTAVLHRALGQKVPVQIPGDVVSALAAIEGQLTAQEPWLKAPGKAEGLRRNLDQFVQEELPRGRRTNCTPA